MAVLRDGRTTETQSKPSSGKPSGISKPSKPKAKAPSSQEKILHDRRLKVKASQDARQKDLETLKGIQSRLDSPETSDESKLQMEESMKTMVKSYADMEKQITENDSDLMEIDSNLRKFGNDEHPTDPIEENGIERKNPQVQTVTEGASEPKESNGTNDYHDHLFFSQSRPDNIHTFVDEEEPSSWADFDIIDLTKDEEIQSDLLGEGKTLLTTNCRSGKLHMNSYGPKNSAMLTWTSTPGASEGKNVTNICSKHHKWAMDTDDNGHFLYKGKIAHIKGISWLPKQDIHCMQDLLDSVEELNPANKASDSKYRFPFSTVLVGWKDFKLSPAYINRSNYKDLTSASKEASKRTDRKFYEIACLQVKRFKDWAGEERLDREKSPTPLEETPEPEAEIQNQNEPSNKGRLAKSQNIEGNDRSQNGQSQNGQSQSGKNQHIKQNGQSGNGQSEKIERNDQNGQIQESSKDMLSATEPGNPKLPNGFTFNKSKFI